MGDIAMVVIAIALVWIAGKLSAALASVLMKRSGKF